MLHNKYGQLEKMNAEVKYAEFTYNNSFIHSSSVTALLILGHGGTGDEPKNTDGEVEIQLGLDASQSPNTTHTVI